MKKEIIADVWSSRLGVIFAVMGSAIGLGNFLRFPGLAAKYGAGSFIVPYIIAILLLGLPICWAEWTLGRMGGKRGFHSSPGIFHALWHNRFSPYLGVVGLIVPLGIFMYYIYIESWCLYYAFKYLTGGMNLGADPMRYTNFFASYVGMDSNGAVLQSGRTAALWFLLASFMLNLFIVYRGLVKGIETVVRYGIPILFLCGLIVLVRVLSLGTPNPDLPEQNVINGLGFMWNPETPAKLTNHPTLRAFALSSPDFVSKYPQFFYDPPQSFWESLANPEMWLAAAGQVFFSLSVGFGVIITYASYLRQKDDVLLSGTTSASGNIFAEVAIGGMITIPAAFIFLGATGIPDSTFALGFITLPNVFAKMPFGNVVGFIWFFLLFLAALTSSLSMIQPAVAFFEEGLGMTRRTSITILGFITAIGIAMVIYFSQGLKALDMMDFWVGTACIYLFATIIVIFFGWGIGARQGFEEARKGSLLRVPNFFMFVIKYVSPLYLLIIFFFWAFEKVPIYGQLILDDSVARYVVLFILLFFVFLSFLVAQAARRWKGERR